LVGNSLSNNFKKYTKIVHNPKQLILFPRRRPFDPNVMTLFIYTGFKEVLILKGERAVNDKHRKMAAEFEGSVYVDAHME